MMQGTVGTFQSVQRHRSRGKKIKEHQTQPRVTGLEACRDLSLDVTVMSLVVALKRAIAVQQHGRR